MLQQLSIQNFTIIHQLDLEFKSGMTVLTGETGAGKSILIDALLLVLGSRADSKVIANGCERCTITASFDLTHLPHAQHWLQQQELTDPNQECQLRRVLTVDGRSRSFINGQSVPLQLLRELGNLLVSIHGQHEHQTLLKQEQQRALLDNYAGHTELVKKIKELYTQWHLVTEEYNNLQRVTEQRHARLELLKYQLNELDQLAPQAEELKKLDQEQRQLANAEQLLAYAQNSVTLLDAEEGSVLKLLNKAQHFLSVKKSIDPKLANASELLMGAIIQVQEAIDDLTHYCESIDLNPECLHKVEQRLSALHEMARKHRIAPENLVDFHQQLQQELTSLQGANNQLEQLQQKLAELSKLYVDAAKELSKSRQLAAKKLAAGVEKTIQQLGMPKGKFAVQLETLPLDQFSSHGMERLEFYCSANPGQDLQSLAKVASGGELSRISLAIHVLTAQNEATPTLIFDEVDVGIGGGTAEIVGRLLAKLGESAQVLCVTHLPQVAALGHHHFQVDKTIQADTTLTEVKVLDKKSKVKEIARMLGGVKITEQTLAHAREMVGITD